MSFLQNIFQSKKTDKSLLNPNPTFIGTEEDFNRFMSSFFRNLVQKITKKHKSEIGKCEHCGKNGVQLDAAHVNGHERKNIIASIVKDYTYGELYKIDLIDFEEKFVQYHEQIENVIKILCKECHMEYDLNFKKDYVTINNEPSISKVMVKNNFILSKSLYGKGHIISFRNKKGELCEYNHDKVLDTIGKRITDLPCWIKNGNYTNSSDVPLFIKDIESVKIIQSSLDTSNTKSKNIIVNKTLKQPPPMAMETITKDTFSKLGRIRLWSNNPNQYNHRIIRAYLDIAKIRNVTIENLKASCRDRYKMTPSSFNSNFASMKTDNGNSHGKVFYEENGYVKVYSKVLDEINKYF
jgi:hypothetical protein